MSIHTNICIDYPNNQSLGMLWNSLQFLINMINEPKSAKTFFFAEVPDHDKSHCQSIYSNGLITHVMNWYYFPNLEDNLLIPRSFYVAVSQPMHLEKHNLAVIQSVEPLLFAKMSLLAFLNNQHSNDLFILNFVQLPSNDISYTKCSLFILAL